MSKFTEMFDKVLKEKLVAKTNVGNTTLGFDDKGTLSAKGKIGSTDVSVDSKDNAQATGKIAGGTMSTAVNKDGDGGSAFNKDGKTVSHTAGSNDMWVSAGPNQISKRVPLNNNKELSEAMEDQQVQYDAHGFATIHHDGKFYLIFNDEVVGEYDNISDLKDAYEHVINKIKLPEEQEISEDNMQEWEIVINGNTYTTAQGATQDEAINSFWKEVVEKEGIKRFLGDMVYAQALNTNEETVVESDEELSDILRIAGLK